MTILQINKFYYPRGGAEVVMLEIEALLKAHGQTVVPFAMRHPSNLPTPYAHSWPSFVETEAVRFGLQGLRTAGRMLYSFEARKYLARLIRTTKPDIAHLHNIYHQLSPSILGVLKRTGIPVVMSVHDWNLISPNYALFDHGEICERGVRSPWGIIRHRCIKDSKVASAFAAAVFWVHKFTRLYERHVDRFIAPSHFVRDKMAAAGFSEEKIVVLPHFVRIPEIPAPAIGDYVGFIGRLSEEKGILTLLEAARSLPAIPFKIAGNGPFESELKKKAEGLRNVEFVGRLDGLLRDRFYRNAFCLVVPSVWFEPLGRVALEAYAFGKPVVASRIGALPEVVREGETGYLVPPRDPQALALRIQELVADSALRARMGEAARKLATAVYNPERYYDELIRIYSFLPLKPTPPLSRHLPLR